MVIFPQLALAKDFMLTEFENQYLDILHNLEVALLSQVQEHSYLSDHDMLRIVKQAILHYLAQQKEPPSVPLSPLVDIQDTIFNALLTICEWRLGRATFSSNLPPCKPITMEELILCLKRIEKSILFWTKLGGRKGYIQFASFRAL
jgi:hypothetical protein